MKSTLEMEGFYACYLENGEFVILKAMNWGKDKITQEMPNNVLPPDECPIFHTEDETRNYLRQRLEK